MSQAISELDSLRKSGGLARRYTVGNGMGYAKEHQQQFMAERLENKTESEEKTQNDVNDYVNDYPPPLAARPPRPSLPLIGRVPPSAHQPSLLSPSDEDLPHFLAARRRSKYELPEIVETPEEDKGIRMFLQRRRSIDCKVRTTRLSLKEG